MNKFQPGLHESVLEAEFDVNTVEDGLTWIVRIPKKISMEASADANSTLCEPDFSSIENFNATSVSTSQIDLSWDPPTASEPFTYTIDRSLTGTDPWVQIVTDLPQANSSFSDQGLNEFTEYFYRIFAGNENGTSDTSFAMTRTQSVLSSSTNLNGKSGDKIGFELTSLAVGATGANPSPLIYQFDDQGDVLVEVVAYKNPSTVAAVVNLLQTKYNRASSKFVLDPGTYVTEDRNLIDVYFDSARLEELNLEEIINFVRPVTSPFIGTIGETGVIYQGDSAQASLDVRKSFKITRTNPTTGLPESVFVDGAGQKIGVLSNSFNTQPFTGTDSRYVTDQKNLDLPGPDNPNYPTPVDVLEESNFQDTDEGRAMLHIVHDGAPGAMLGFHAGTLSLNKFVEGVNELSLAGYNLLVDDITFLGESFFAEEGPVYDAIDEHINRAPGNMHFSSAGNFADIAIEGTLNFVPLPASDVYPPGTTAFIHDFGGGDFFQQIFANQGEYVLAFQWDQPFASLGDPVGATVDLDMFVVNNMLELEAGNNRINIDGDAAEILVLRAEAGKAANLIFTCECTTPPTGLSYRMVAFKTDGDGDGLVFTEPISGPTVTGHAGFDIDNLITVGASFYGYYGNSSLGPEIEPFSSTGFPGVVNYTGADGGNTNVLSIGTDINFDSDIFPNFFGTSAAAPLAASTNALLLSAMESWYPTGVPAATFVDASFATGNPADEATGLIVQTASPLSNPAAGGVGLLRAEEAFKTIASQTPLLTGYSADSTQIISIDTVVVTLFGDYFTEESQVFFNGESIETTFISETELQVTIQPFSGTGGFVVTSSPSITPTGGDGGDSNPIDLLDGRRAITIIADDTTRTFGQDYDNLSFSISGLVGDETYDSLGLPAIVLTSTAVGSFPDIGNYIVTPSFATPLSDEQKDEFIVAFQKGVLSFNSLPLTIQPMDTSSFYGDAPIIVLEYIYDDTGISDNTAFLNTLKAAHESTYLTDSVGGLVNRFSAVVNRFSAVVNENPGRVNELLNLIQNSNWLATETSIQNRFSAVVNDFNIVPIDADQLLDYLDDPLVGNSSSLENRFSAVVNGDDMVSGLTSVYDPLENRFSPVVNRFSAVVNRFSAVVNIPLGDENDSTDLTQTLAIIDAEDGGNPESDTVDVYSINLITGLDVTVTNEGRHYMVSGAALAPIFTNFVVTYQAARLTVNPLPITVSLDDIEEKMYGDSIVFSSSVSGALAYLDTMQIDYLLNPVPAASNPVSVGNYLVEQLITTRDSTGTENLANYDITVINGPLVVNPRPITVSLDALGEKNYGDSIAFSSTISGELVSTDTLEVDYNLNPVPSANSPVSAGTYLVEQTVTIKDSIDVDNTSNYDLTLVNGSLIVNPGTLTIITEDILINGGDDIPAASEITTTITGIIQGESESDVFPPSGPVFSYSSPEYEMMGREAGTYLLLTTVTPDPENYTVVYDGAQLFVNLSSGKKIRVYLDCVADNKGQGDFPFTAYFSYDNDNDVSIFIQPMSPDNLLVGTSFDPSSLPFEFFPGSHQFAVPFEGELRWQVATFGSVHNSSQQVDSDNVLKGQRCKGNDIINGRTAGPESDPEDLSIFNAEEVQFYPNPVNDRLTVRVNKNFSNHDFELYDSQGIRHRVNAAIRSHSIYR